VLERIRRDQASCDGLGERLLDFLDVRIDGVVALERFGEERLEPIGVRLGDGSQRLGFAEVLEEPNAGLADVAAGVAAAPRRAGLDVFTLSARAAKPAGMTPEEVLARRTRAQSLEGVSSFITAIERSNPPRPSIRASQPDTPPTQREVQEFLRRLRKASFQSGSIGFLDWMKDIGVDPDAGDDSPDDQQLAK
jgi:hypothetical protein